MKSFPQPLGAVEEQEMLMQCKAGNQEARNTLIERNLRLVAHIVKKYGSPERETDDLISIGTIGLIKAIDSFDTKKGIRLATYAARCIDNELLMMLRSNRKQSREVYLNDSIGCDKEGNEISLLDIVESVDEDITERMETEENVSRLTKYINEVLNEREREIIFLRYGIPDGNEITQREIADQYGISRSYVSRIEKKCLQKLRKRFNISIPYHVEE